MNGGVIIIGKKGFHVIADIVAPLEEAALPVNKPYGSAGTAGARGPAGTEVLEVIVTPSPVGNMTPTTDGKEVPRPRPGGRLDLRRTKEPIKLSRASNSKSQGKQVRRATFL